MADDTQTHHAIDYIEIYVTDMVAARTFYETAFGWQFNEYGPAYLGIQNHGGGESGGLCLADEIHVGGALVVLYSEDLEATLDAVQAAGGRVSKPPAPFPGGRRFTFADPSGNELAVWSR